MSRLDARLQDYATLGSQDESDAEVMRDYYQSIIDSVGSVVYTVNRNLRIMGVNRQWDAFARAHGEPYPDSQNVVGTPALTLMGRAYRERWRAVCRQLLDGEESRYVDEVVRGGAATWSNYSLMATPLRSTEGRILGITFIATDRTRFKKAETEMLRRMVEVRGLRKVAQIAGVRFDERAFYQEITSDLAHLFGAEKCVFFLWGKSSGHLQAQVPAYGLSGRGMADLSLDIGDPSEPDSLWQDLEEKDYVLLNESNDDSNETGVVSAGADRLAAMVAVLRVGGRIHGAILVAGRDRLFTDQDGDLLATFAVPIVLALEDAELNQRLLERTKQLSALRKELDRVSWVANRIRKPLTVVRGYIELLVDGAMGPLPDAQVKTMSMLLERTRDLVAVADELLPSELLYGARGQPIFLVDMVQELVEKHLASARLAGLDLVAQLPAAVDEKFVAYGDENALSAVFDALIEHGISLGAAGGTICASLHESDGIVYFSVHAPQVDRMSQQARQARQTTGQNMFFGSMSRTEAERVVQDHGGHLWVEGHVAEGMTFYVVLPTGIGR